MHKKEAELAMGLNAGAVVIILVLGACAAAAIYFAVRGYLLTRRDPFARDDDQETIKAKKPEESQEKADAKTDRDAPPPPG